ncbi:hypothetical protein ACQ3G6_13080 [Allorhizobium undicola]|uniref:hypothetical protein n=1 Tax=Allorhizobium undicola TaxID=78527 RepID=UPI0004827991|nr:hypothetical protein [Allorhizobium undicola]
MLLKQSLFQSVVDRLEDENEENREEDGHDDQATSFRIMGLGTGFVKETGSAEASLQTVQSLYDDFLEDVPLPEEPQPPVMPAHLSRLTPDEIRDDLGLSDEDDLQSLALKRRSFARLNHPDRVNAAFREQANQRMTLANQMIDQALQRLARNRPD